MRKKSKNFSGKTLTRSAGRKFLRRWQIREVTSTHRVLFIFHCIWDRVEYVSWCASLPTQKLQLVNVSNYQLESITDIDIKVGDVFTTLKKTWFFRFFITLLLSNKKKSLQNYCFLCMLLKFLYEAAPLKLSIYVHFADSEICLK